MSADEEIQRIARTVLYEGYLLYPYTRSSTKNQVRWMWGAVHPPGTPGETSALQAEVLVRDQPGCRVRITPRCLQLVVRESAGEPPWEEAEERELADLTLAVEELLRGPVQVDVTLAGGSSVGGAERRSWQAIAGRVEVRAERPGPGLVRLRARVENVTAPVSGTAPGAARSRAMVSTHLVIRVERGVLISLTDPPPDLAAAAAGCRQEGLWPVLVGDARSDDAMLASPIILEDHPRIAGESPGDLFDATEIDEILSLRILTLSDAEKEELRSTDPRAAALLDRTEGLTGEELLRLHGTLRDVGPRAAPDPLAGIDVWGEPEPLQATPWSHGTLRVGDRVRLRPGGGADAFDAMLRGRAGRIESIVQELEGGVQVAVLLDDDPGADLGRQRLPGHRFFYRVHEVEPA